MPCSYVPPQDGSLTGMLDYVDCQAQTIGGDGYLALAAPGSPASLALTGLLTILVALYGYRLLFGYTPGVRDLVLTLVKIGIVVALATGWAGYRTLFYDLVLRGPAEVTGVVGGAAGLPGATGGLAAHIEGTDRLYQALAIANERPTSGYQDPQTVAPPLFTGFTTFALGWSRVMFLVGAIGAFAAVRLTAGLLLALGPLFIAFLLFEATRGLFVGWVRVLAGAALGAVATSIVLGVELAMIEPWLADLVARRSAAQSIAGAPAQLLAVSIVFDIALLAAIVAVAKVTWSLNPMQQSWFGSAGDASNSVFDRFEVSKRETRSSERIDAGRSRASAVAGAVETIQRHEADMAGGLSTSRGPGVSGLSSAAGGRQPTSTSGGRSSALGIGTARRTSGRVSASAGRRDAVR